MKKSTIKLLTTLCLIFTLAFTLAIPCFANTIQIMLNGSTLKSNVAPLQQNGTTLVPIRLISENLGANVNYEKTEKKISIVTDQTSIELFVNNTTAKINGKTITLNVAPQIINNTTMVPIRFVSENLNCSVEWNQEKQLVIITSNSSLDSTLDNNLTQSALPTATIKVKNYGTITLELYPKLAPNTVNNFIFLANSGFYDGLTFHRVISDFIIQGGDPLGNGTGGPGYYIPGEFLANGFTANTLSHTAGVISMARSSNMDSAGCQFFITSADSTYLDGQYAAFGKVTDGMDVVTAISMVATNANDAPLETIQIESIKVDTHNVTYAQPVGTMY